MFLQITRMNLALSLRPCFKRPCNFCSNNLQHSSSKQNPEAYTSFFSLRFNL
uniref:Nucleolar RNA-associated protein n=1 Tax=Rhizophora mucronata TaxID=61149 RepID=A0A2P2LWI2_RHIMU